MPETRTVGSKFFELLQAQPLAEIIVAYLLIKSLKAYRQFQPRRRVPFGYGPGQKLKLGKIGILRPRLQGEGANMRTFEVHLRDEIEEGRGREGILIEDAPVVGNDDLPEISLLVIGDDFPEEIIDLLYDLPVAYMILGNLRRQTTPQALGPPAGLGIEDDEQRKPLRRVLKPPLGRERAVVLIVESVGFSRFFGPGRYLLFNFIHCTLHLACFYRMPRITAQLIPTFLYRQGSLQTPSLILILDGILYLGQNPAILETPRVL